MISQTPSHLLVEAAQNGHLARVQELLDQAADANYVHDTMVDHPYHEDREMLEDTATALGSAAAGDHLGVVQLLLDRGARVEAFDNWGRTALWRAAECGSLPTMRLLLARGASANAHSCGGFDGESNRVPGPSVLQAAAAAGQTEAVRLLLECGADADDRGPALQAAALAGQPGTAQLLLNGGAKLTDAILVGVVEKGNHAMARLLLEEGGDPVNKGHADPLWRALDRGDRVMALLLAEYADPNGRNANGCTVLGKACYTRQAEVLKLLLEAGADPNTSDGGTHRPLLGPCQNGDLEIVRLLLRHGGDSNTGDSFGTALSYAAEGGHLEIVHLLLAHGADPNQEAGHGITALYKSINKGHTEVASALKAAGAKGKWWYVL